MPPHLRMAAALACAAPFLAAGCGDEPSTPPRAARSNVVLISLDSTRRDLLGAYGNRPAHAPNEPVSPHLDALAAGGVQFLEAYSTTSWTLPSHVTLLAGEPELVHGVEMDYLRPDPAQETLPGVMKRHGYYTAGFYTGPYLDPVFGFARGFDRYEAAYGGELAAAAARLNAAEAELLAARARRDSAAFKAAQEEQTVAYAEVDRLSARDSSSATVVDLALAEVDRARANGRPFFLFLHFFDPHYDYIPPPPHDQRFDPEYEGAVNGERFFENPAVGVLDPQLPSGRRRAISDRDLEHVRALYEGELAWTDAQIGRLLAGLEQRGLREETLLVVSSDHGDEFFEHDAIGHRRTLFEEVVRVPLILNQPGRLDPARVAGPVSNVDVFATVLELAGVPVPDDTSSRSLAPLEDGRAAPVAQGVFGRLVTQRPVQLPIRTPEGEFLVPCLELRVTETFRHGRIKVTREVSWPEANTPQARPYLAERRAAARAAERLVWIDVEAHPDERAEDHSEQFDAPGAQAALNAFRTRYVELLARRRAVREQDPDEGSVAGLEALGYAGGQEKASGALDELFLLPPPGEL